MSHAAISVDMGRFAHRRRALPVPRIFAPPSLLKAWSLLEMLRRQLGLDGVGRDA
jgi:hypothetical protein